jgi:hypothetical protein
VPNGATREAIYHINSQFCGSPSRIHNFRGCTRSDTFWITIAPHVLWKNAFVPLINQIAYRLTHKMSTDGMYLEPMPSQ